ncbi:ribose-phosphate pyrophosphokinase [Thermotoga maritima MSB8]|uniref:Ribose-phosphate pyrophosphokinase n=1 Tax=Thermotoga maritima (strain ATCC 43589 / DSM 3109 / JCM 10099 / NBRC 100826 / MSB8) TaxID=243274 RepID=KPRS_THEMA|nr:ribose-phosphate pyrophosphokinase [Thermotoga maritima]Q9X1W3.1 RecName: Full=Ribose-phosphate pyrophosphokinase; Short=RPPK; AltName: Full=5-phospho-D-ribosyl alpha-1-diphosphate synthase; AltName: Full=Phosphoribosyl diphosphate synthase; AltName: Full=Phosphoribosyl pyrophosphate synthase; Short=P-Rib-PP synthase; Short=PRPP synthase; Short=PRPPase [Thermotoga maritima MSB8]AAD36695.1 phosphoribosyl pyrophosphate synthetase [Thermotoga maritima MSB8]AGL50561.1 Ribose-phosphate pyrophospho
MSFSNEMKVFSGNANRPLAEKIANYLNLQLGDCEVGRFADGEINVRINETVRGHDIFLIQPTSPPVNENLMELLIMIDAFKRASANTIAVVIPYYGYARQDRKAKGRDPISAKLVANLITVAGATRVLTVDLHAEQIQGFFDIPVDNLWSYPVFAEELLKRENIVPEETVVVSPDVGGVRRARRMAERLGTSLAILDKRRPSDNVAEVVNIIGEVEDKVVIMFDDIIDTAHSIVKGAEALKNAGAKRIIACATHGVFSDRALERIENSSIDTVYITDTIYHENLPEKVKVISVANLIGEAIMRIRKHLSVSTLFR